MKNQFLSISLSFFFLSFTVVPVLTTEHKIAMGGNSSAKISSPGPDLKSLYENLHLQDFGMSEDVFDYAMKGFYILQKKKKINNPDYITICDFSQSSRNKRLYLIDLKNDSLLINTYVAHGRNSGGEYANRFSNKMKSRESSLGFYITGNTYRGKHGLALTINGQEPGINNNAARRRIVIHGSKYVGENYLEFSRFMGRSFGCPAVPQDETNTIINTIKNGTCFFIYHPNKKYLKGSKILNG